jgi:hypothetical protein
VIDLDEMAELFGCTVDEIRQAMVKALTGDSPPLRVEYP